jgi:hypothetical protein
MMSEPRSGVHWVSAGDSPFGVDVLDCRAFSQSMISTTQDQRIADSYLNLRASSGEQYRGCAPENAVACECDLRYPHMAELRDGPLFKAQAMEDKWDIYLYDGYLYFARSWTGLLAFRARVLPDDDGMNVVGVEAGAGVPDGDPFYCVAAVDFLIRSHLLGLPVAHPLPKDVGKDANELTMFSFSQFGRWARFGTFADTTRLGPAAGEDV